jgi:ribosomal protein L7/L12
MKTSYVLALVNKMIDQVDQAQNADFFATADCLKLYLEGSVKKPKVFRAVLTRIGEGHFLHAIKEVRLTTGTGFKEAKDFCELVRNAGKPQTLATGDENAMLKLKIAFDNVFAQVDVEEVKDAL